MWQLRVWVYCLTSINSLGHSLPIEESDDLRSSFQARSIVPKSLAFLLVESMLIGISQCPPQLHSPTMWCRFLISAEITWGTASRRIRPLTSQILSSSFSKNALLSPTFPFKGSRRFISIFWLIFNQLVLPKNVLKIMTCVKDVAVHVESKVTQAFFFCLGQNLDLTRAACVAGPGQRPEMLY